MNGVHFNYTNTAPYVAYYRKEGGLKTGTRGLWQERKGLKTTRKMEFKGGGTQGKHVNTRSEATEETKSKKRITVTEIRP